MCVKNLREKLLKEKNEKNEGGKKTQQTRIHFSQRMKRHSRLGVVCSNIIISVTETDVYLHKTLNLTGWCEDVWVLVNRQVSAMKLSSILINNSKIHPPLVWPFCFLPPAMRLLIDCNNTQYKFFSCSVHEWIKNILLNVTKIIHWWRRTWRVWMNVFRRNILLNMKTLKKNLKNSVNDWKSFEISLRFCSIN